MNTFDDFWELYDNKKSREKVERKWFSLSAKDQQDCMNSLPAYIRATPDRQYRKHPATYLNNKCWNDKIYTQGETSLTIAWSKDKPVSDYEPKEFNPEDGKSHMREKLRMNYENGTPIKDWGDIYTTLLTDKCGMVIPDNVIDRIESKVWNDATRPRNKFELQYIGDPKANIRDAKLNWWLSDQRKQGREIYLEIDN